uniref:Uncharacterized protein n=1 Tax=Panagrolaimus sp. PS1159 TaxID=55785 RepID=A0AC35FPJ4_9BILA
MIKNYNVFYGTQHVSYFPEMKVQFSRECKHLIDDVPISIEIPPMCEQITNNIELYKNGKIIVNAEYIINITPQEMKKQIVKISIPRNTTSKYIFNENQKEFTQKKFLGKFNKYLFKFVFIDGLKQIGFKVGKIIFRNMISMMEEGIPFSSENKCSTNDNMQLIDNEGNPTNLTGTSIFCCSSFSVWRNHGEL